MEQPSADVGAGQAHEGSRALSGIWGAVSDMAKDVLDLLFPEEKGCVLCGRVGERLMEEVFYASICSGCLARIPFVKPPYCKVCGRPVRGERAFEHADRAIQCRTCAAGGRFFEAGRAVGVYDGALKELVREFKFCGRRELAEGLGVLMARTAVRDKVMRGADITVPVPLHPKRLEERGYNQAELLADMVASCLGPPMRPALRRTIWTPEQSKLRGRFRHGNVRGTFAVPHPTVVAGKRILLIDDVITTGLTVNECARSLLRAGASRVLVLALAVTPLEKEWLVPD